MADLGVGGATANDHGVLELRNNAGVVKASIFGDTRQLRLERNCNHCAMSGGDRRRSSAPGGTVGKAAFSWE
jgi:hypothetical protein